MSAFEKTGPLIRVRRIALGSNGQLHLVSSIIVFNRRACIKTLSDSPFLGIITRLVNMFLLVSDSVLTAGIVSKCVIISNKCFTRSCYSMAIQVARFFKYCCGFQRWIELNRDFTYKN